MLSLVAKYDTTVLKLGFVIKLLVLGISFSIYVTFKSKLVLVNKTINVFFSISP